MINYPDSIAVLNQHIKFAVEPERIHLVRRLIEGAKLLDIQKLASLGTNFRFSHIKRNFEFPPDYTHDSILGAPWADHINHPLEQGEKWNEGRRATSTGLSYVFNSLGLPINPYMNTGLEGRGVLGQFGPNHAVDNGVLVMKADQKGIPTLYVLGILRKFDNDAPAFSGGFAKYKRGEGGEYRFDRDEIIESQVEELFEEMISGSISLLPEYQASLTQGVAQEIEERLAKRQGRPLSDDSVHEITEQYETALKLQQVKEKDPEFIARLRQVVSSAHECFAGPVLNDNRNTNNAWIESRLSWFLLDDKTWGFIKGSKPIFDYQFVAGDDASGVVYHRLDTNFVERAYASHGAMAVFMAASFLLHAEKEKMILQPEILNQLTDIADSLRHLSVGSCPIIRPNI